ncbi:MAG: hypothetical protein AVDCRST_MAG73-3468 [uncultured Thermomicrobiales bacterium]|uniref:Uncharacterized protein n=1 Tax=uncultured Thermomicrobiales bacterium TaxID=1645740 RepID=A0A6J4URB1_9BACT|nr:MAG: hypothetical protein AVDCRST_MAG73-3468 [uncultured Thermomicrobiales bacterium]
MDAATLVDADAIVSVPLSEPPASATSGCSPTVLSPRGPRRGEGAGVAGAPAPCGAVAATAGARPSAFSVVGRVRAGRALSSTWSPRVRSLGIPGCLCPGIHSGAVVGGGHGLPHASVSDAGAYARASGTGKSG